MGACSGLYYRTLQNFTVTVRLIELFGGSLCGTVLPYLAKFHSHSSPDRAVWWELVRDCSPFKMTGNSVIVRGKVETANPKKRVDDSLNTCYDNKNASLLWLNNVSCLFLSFQLITSGL